MTANTATRIATLLAGRIDDELLHEVLAVVRELETALAEVRDVCPDRDMEKLCRYLRGMGITSKADLREVLATDCPPPGLPANGEGVHSSDPDYCVECGACHD